MRSVCRAILGLHTVVLKDLGVYFANCNRSQELYSPTGSTHRLTLMAANQIVLGGELIWTEDTKGQVQFQIAFLST